MDIAKYALLFSDLRISKYVKACNSNIYKGIELYKYNIQISQALYPTISILEIALRNSIDRALSKHYNDQAWLINQRANFANHPNLTYKNNKGIIKPDYFFSNKINKAEDKLRFRQINITHGKLLAELTFGFWVKFFDASPIKILQGAPLDAFKNKPKMNLSLVNSHLNSIVTLRNRISHSEPICFNRSGNLCPVTLKQYETDIFEALNWIE